MRFTIKALLLIATIAAVFTFFALRSKKEKDESEGWASSTPRRAQGFREATNPRGPTGQSASPVHERVQTKTKSTSADQDAALATLESLSAKPWTVRRDLSENRIRTLARGETALHEGETPSQAADSFVAHFAKALFGVDPENLFMTKTETTDRTRIVYQENFEGVPVYGATLTLFYENGALSRVQSDLASSEAPSPNTPRLSQAEAFSAYQRARGDSSIVLKSGKPILFAQASPMSASGSSSDQTFAYAYQFVTLENADGGRQATYTVLFDAETPHVIKRTSSEVQ